MNQKQKSIIDSFVDHLCVVCSEWNKVETLNYLINSIFERFWPTRDISGMHDFWSAIGRSRVECYLSFLDRYKRFLKSSRTSKKSSD